MWKCAFQLAIFILIREPKDTRTIVIFHICILNKMCKTYSYTNTYNTIF